ncbi:hypothetical protein PIB30_091551 [Stylosanthes scabra]|uniref:Uncharacterized protein n=1 Tax=Stylosanthes scabra TaxID=79078 RepID=A0ABU6ZT83_9FABA|nr:hypothetical protein [Stylosanthes scabra]
MMLVSPIFVYASPIPPSLSLSTPVTGYLISFFPYLEELYEVGTPPKPKKGILGVGTKVADKESLFGTNLQFAVLSVLR